MQPLVSVIIVNWNGASLLDNCLQSLTNQSYKKLEILVWDNHSQDNSRAVVRKYPKTRFIANSDNSGFALANTMAARQARGKYILLLNNDTVVTNNFLTKLVGILEKDATIGVVQPMLRYRGNPLYTNGTINSVGAYMTPTGFLYYPHYGKKPGSDKKPSTVYSAYGACMLIRADVIARVGLFDGDFFAYFEETDFCHRVWLAGYSVICVPSVYIHHIGGVSAQKHKAANILYHSYKNRVCSYIKNLGVYQLWRIIPVHIFLIMLLALMYAVTGKLLFCWAIIRALWWNLVHLRETLSKRRYIQRSIRAVPDRMFASTVLRRPPWKYYYYLIAGLEKYEA